MVTNVALSQQTIHWHALIQTSRAKREVDMNKQIQELMQQAGTDTSGKWMSVDNAEKFAMLVIEQYNKELQESRREIKRTLGYSRIGLNNI